MLTLFDVLSLLGKKTLWVDSLDAKRTYYEGVVDDAQTVITQHSDYNNDTVTTFGTEHREKQ